MESLVVDRVENNIAICEDNELNIVEISIYAINGRVREGDVIVVEKNNKYKVDLEETKKRKKYIEDLTKGMWTE